MKTAPVAPALAPALAFASHPWPYSILKPPRRSMEAASLQASAMSGAIDPAHFRTRSANPCSLYAKLAGRDASGKRLELGPRPLFLNLDTPRPSRFAQDFS